MEYLNSLLQKRKFVHERNKRQRVSNSILKLKKEFNDLKERDMKLKKELKKKFRR